MSSSSRDETVSPSSSNPDRRDVDIDLEDDDCLSDIGSEASDPSQLEDIDPVSDTRSASPQPNPLITNNPFLPPHLQHPVKLNNRQSNADLVRPLPLSFPPPPPHPSASTGIPTALTLTSPLPQATSGQESNGLTVPVPATSSNTASINSSSPQQQQPDSGTPASPQSSPKIIQRPLFKPHELALSPTARTTSSSAFRSDHLVHPQPTRPDRSPVSDRRSPSYPDSGVVKREPHPAFNPHHEMLSQFAAARAEFLNREAIASREFDLHERNVPMAFKPRDLRLEFCKNHDLVRQDFSKAHEQFTQEALNNYARQNGVLGSAS